MMPSLLLAPLWLTGVISMTALGLGVSDEAAQEASSAAQHASDLLDQLFPALMSAFRYVRYSVSKCVSANERVRLYASVCARGGLPPCCSHVFNHTQVTGGAQLVCYLVYSWCSGLRWTRWPCP
jgi:hypothetical protein